MYNSGLPSATSLKVLTNGIDIFSVPISTATLCPRANPSFKNSSPSMFVTRFPNGPSVAMISPVNPLSSACGASIFSLINSLLFISGPTCVQSSPRARYAPTGEKISRP